MPSIRRRTRIATVAVAALALVVLTAAAASAHVHVDPDETAAGEFTVLTVRVPNESATAETRQVVVDLPTDHPLLSVSTKPIPGWTAAVVKAPLPEPVDFFGTTLTEAPATVTWTATAGSEIADGQFQEFEISVGPLPDDGTELAFPTHQVYTDGTVVDWTEPTPDSGEEPEHPLPTFTTTAADGEGHDHAAPAGAEATPTVSAAATATPTASEQEDQPDTIARTLAVVALALGGAALVVALAARGRRAGA
ncbi:YcnI family protein [Cellulomonas sp. URHD0024]|uniref:YcnI family copper-binding membrane protein n=1 Tax=Cellulomonas sp. URHD0024 TaxID=1302620 RepID=UPI0004059B9C|nr:YcnI family protein [Cellulomonas sp. URHD0024]